MYHANNYNKILTLVILLFLAFSSYSQENKYTIVIDPGHGGKDPGNTGNGYLEKNIALKIALGLGEILEKNNNYKIIYTRKDDRFIDLFKRAKIANDSNADLFISIHCDAHNSNAYGAGTFVLGLHANERNFQIAKKENSVIFLEENYEQKYDGFDPSNPESVISLVLMQEEYLDQSINAANFIQQSFVRNLNRRNRSVKQAGFIVLKYTYMPSVLVETGFLTNKTEGKYLNSKKGQSDMSISIADAIDKYFQNVKNEITNYEILSESNIEKQDELIFKVRIAVGSKLIPLKSYNFKGLKSLSYDKENGIYKYFYEKTSNYQIAIKNLIYAQKKGFKDSFIVLFKNGSEYNLDKYLSENEK
jgi:N-acetylmuramoyl-L-alanine amidase